jgi:hypothetical protein
MIREPRPAIRRFIELVPLNISPHRPVEDDDALLEQFGERVRGGIKGHEDKLMHIS